MSFNDIIFNNPFLTTILCLLVGPLLGNVAIYLLIDYPNDSILA